MQSAVSGHHIAHLANLQGKCCIFKWFLHLITTEPTKIATIRVGGAIRISGGALSEFGLRSVDLSLIPAKDGDRLLFRARNVNLYNRR